MCVAAAGVGLQRPLEQVAHSSGVTQPRFRHGPCVPQRTRAAALQQPARQARRTEVTLLSPSSLNKLPAVALSHATVQQEAQQCLATWLPYPQVEADDVCNLCIFWLALWL